MKYNPNCDGQQSYCKPGEVRVLPIGGSANLILCRACFEHEMQYNRERAREKNVDPRAFPIRKWEDLRVYEIAQFARLTTKTKDQT